MSTKLSQDKVEKQVKVYQQRTSLQTDHVNISFTLKQKENLKWFSKAVFKCLKWTLYFITPQLDREIEYNSASSPATLVCTGFVNVITIGGTHLRRLAPKYTVQYETSKRVRRGSFVTGEYWSSTARLRSGRYRKKKHLVWKWTNCMKFAAV